MMKKYVLRLLALILVLCMIVPCMPVGALATELTRPEGMTDEEWEWELLRQKQLEQLAKEQAAATPPVTEETLPQTDSLSKSEEGNLVVTDTAVVPNDTTKVPEGASAEVKKQNVSVELPAEAGTIKTDSSGTKDVITNEYETTIDVEKPDGTTVETDVTVKESYDLEAEVTKVETEGSGTQNVTDITYEISLDASVSAEKAKTETPEEVVKNDVVEDIDVKANQAAKEEKLPEPQYKVDMTANGMNAEEITRVEHTYYTPKQSSTTSAGSDSTAATEAHTEYYYNAKNGTEDTTKKYFTVSVVEKVKEGATNVKETVKETVVSLWTSFLGVFHITTDAFEGAEKTDGTKDTYSNLTEAAEKNTGKTVEMLRDYETTSTAAISNDVTVDMNEHKYTNTSDTTAIKVTGSGNEVAILDGNIISNGAAAEVSDSGNTFSIWNTLLRSNDDGDDAGSDAALKVNGSGNTVNIAGRSWIDGTRSTYGVDSKGSKTDKNTVNISKSKVEGKTGVSLTNSDATLSRSILRGSEKEALRVEKASETGIATITSGRFESGKGAANVYAEDDGRISITGGRFTKSTDLYDYIHSDRYAVISHNDGSYYGYEVVGTKYTPSREGYEFLGYKDANGKTITLKEAAQKDIVAYAQWKEIPETTTKQVALITVKTDVKGGTAKITYKGDTAFITVKNAKGEFLPISEMTIPSIKRLQNKKIDTVEIQVDEDVKLVLDIEKAKENGFTDIVEVMLEKDMLLITSGQDTCVELDIAELKAADKPVEIQLVEGELTVRLGKNSSMTVDLTKALKTKERIVVKLENGVLKLYDKYHKPIKD